MKILFICKGNAERSAMAEFFFARLSKKHKVSSAGANVERSEAEGKPPGKIISELMLGLGHYSFLRHKRKQVTKDMVKNADRVIVILSKREIKKHVPDYIRNSEKTTFWISKYIPRRFYDIYPPPHYLHHAEMVGFVRRKVGELVKEIG